MLNVGILAHVDAGKTSLTERLLFAAGVIGEAGSVDDGSAHTDSLELERQRGITIKSAVVSFRMNGVTVNLIDTPGHPDFIAGVERVLSVLDGAVLVISAVEGVQAQTRVLLRALERLRIPALIFVSKIDRRGAGYGRVLRDISAKLTPAIAPMGTVDRLGTAGAGFTPHGAGDAAFTAGLANVIADHDDDFLAAYVCDETAITYRRLRRSLAALSRRGLVHPVYFGSAITGAGVASLAAGVAEFLPRAGADAGAPVSGTVFKVERGPAGEKIAYARMLSGTLRVRDRVRLGRDGTGKVTAVRVFGRGTATPRSSVAAGQIGMLWGLDGVRIGDTLGAGTTRSAGHHFAPPTLETVVTPGRPADRGRLHAALSALAEQDPLINLRQDEARQELLVSLYGEVQKEVIQATLARDFGVEALFHGTTTICVERLCGTGEAVEVIGQPPNPFLATIGLRTEPAPPGSGVRFGVEIERGSLPPAFVRAVEETVRATLRQGIHGWEIPDCSVTLARSGYWARQSHAHGTFDTSMSSTAGDFRNLAPLVLMTALTRAGTVVHEPVHRFRLEVPAGTVGPVLPALALLGATPRTRAARGAACVLEGEIPAAAVHGLQRQLPALSRGEGLLEYTFSHYRPVRDAIPARPRTDHNPLDRKEYLLHVTRGVATR